MQQNNNQLDLTSLARKWPSSFVSRDRVAEFSGGILHPRTMANIDCKGEGPKRIRIGRKVVYPVNDLCEWLSKRSCKLE